MHVKNIHKSFLIYATLLKSTYVALNESNSGSLCAGEDAAGKQQAFPLSKASSKKETCMFMHNHSARYFNKINVDAIGNQVWEALALQTSSQLSSKPPRS